MAWHTVGMLSLVTWPIYLIIVASLYAPGAEKVRCSVKVWSSSVELVFDFDLLEVEAPLKQGYFLAAFIHECLQQDDLTAFTPLRIPLRGQKPRWPAS